VEVISVSGRRRQHWSSLIVAVPYGCGSSHRQCCSRAIDGVIRTVTVADTSLSSTCVEVISVSGRRRQHWSSLIVAVPYGCGSSHRQCYSRAIDGVNSYRCRHVIVVKVSGSHFRFRSSSTALVVAHRRRSIRVRLQPSSVLQSSDRRRNTNSYRCRHVIVVNVRGSHFRFRSSSTALVVAHRRRSIRVRLQPSSVLQSSDRRRNTNSYRCRHVIVVKVSGSHFRFRSSSTALVVAHRRRSIRVRLQPSSVLQSSDRRRNTNSYRCRHVIVVNVRGSHFRFRSSSTALVVAHRCRSIRVRLQPSSVLQSSDRRRNTNSYRCRHVIVVNVRGSHLKLRST
jgi:predicted RNA binding protein YcfA (HicA-like mRNA interferase family)